MGVRRFNRVSPERLSHLRVLEGRPGRWQGDLSSFRLHGISLVRRQRGWSAEVLFSVETSRQFTPEHHAAQSGGRWLLTAAWNGWREARWQARLLTEGAAARRRAQGWMP